MRRRSSNQRCSICDYTEWNGSEYADISPNQARVVYDSDHNGYFCTTCLGSILSTINSYSEPNSSKTHPVS